MRVLPALLAILALAPAALAQETTPTETTPVETTPAETTPTETTPAPEPVQTTTICHATFDPDPPYVTLELGGDQVDVHRGHRGDIIAAPAGGCPTSVEIDEPEPEPEPEPDPETESETETEDEEQQTAPVVSPPSAGTPSATSRPAATSGRGLPTTGWAPEQVALLGMIMLLAGTGVWLGWAGPRAAAAARTAVAMPAHLTRLRPRPPRPPARPRPPAPSPETADPIELALRRIEAIEDEFRQ